MTDEHEPPRDAVRERSWALPGPGPRFHHILLLGVAPVVAVVPIVWSAIEVTKSPIVWLLDLLWVVAVGIYVLFHGRWCATSLTMDAEGVVTLSAPLRTVRTTAERFRDIRESGLGHSSLHTGSIGRGLLLARTRDGTILLARGLDVGGFVAALHQRDPTIPVEPWVEEE